MLTPWATVLIGCEARKKSSEIFIAQGVVVKKGDV
jgi:hypothetical protein